MLSVALTGHRPCLLTERTEYFFKKESLLYFFLDPLYSATYKLTLHELKRSSNILHGWTNKFSECESKHRKKYKTTTNLQLISLFKIG